MKVNTTLQVVIIAIGLAILYFMDPFGWFGQRNVKVEPPKVQAARDSVIVSQAQVKALLKREAALIELRKQDSLKSLERDRRHKKEVAALKKTIADISFKQATSGELDSIRAELFDERDYVDEPSYSMPIGEARVALAAVAREPLKDQLISKLENRIDSMVMEHDAENKLNADLLKSCNERANEGIDAFKSLQVVSDHYQKEATKQQKLRWIDRVGGAVLGFFAGRGTK